MKLHLKLTSLFLVILLLASAAGCTLPGIGDESAEKTTEDKTANTTFPDTDPGTEMTTMPLEPMTEPVPETTPDPPETTEGGYTFNDPVVPNYNATVGVLAWKDSDFTEFEVEYEKAGDSILSKAIYERLIKTEELLGVDIEFTYTVGNTSNTKAWNTYVTNCVSAASREYDFIAGSSLAIAQNALNGLLCNLLAPEFEAFDPSKPYFFESYGTDARLGSSLYFTTGSFSVNALTSIYVCYANSDRLQAYNLDDPRTAVINGEWTLDKFLEMCHGAYNDDGDGLKNSADSFGYITSQTRTDAWYYGSGARFFDLLYETGGVIISPMYDSEQVFVLAERLASLLHSSADGFISNKVADAEAAFASDRALFVTEPLGMALGEEMKNAENLSYYLLPIPKFDLNQPQYYSTLANQHTLFAITLDCPDRERAATVLECFAQYGFEKLMPAVYREATGNEYASSVEETSMFEIIRQSVVYDHARVFSRHFNGQNADFRAVIFDNEASSLSIRMKQVSRILEKSLLSFNDKFSQMN